MCTFSHPKSWTLPVGPAEEETSVPSQDGNPAHDSARTAEDRTPDLLESLRHLHV